MPDVRRPTGPAGTGYTGTVRDDGTGQPQGSGQPGESAEISRWAPRLPASGTWGGGTSAASRLTASVGAGTANKPADVRIVQARLRELGFPVGRDGVMDVKTAKSLRLVEAIFAGAEHATDVQGKMAPGSELEKRLFQPNAPRWQRLPDGGVGWKNIDGDNHNWGTSVLAKVLDTAGVSYDRDFHAKHPGKDLLQSNDASRPAGGDTRDHDSHEAGLDLDLRLPSTDGKRTSVKMTNFDKEAAVAQIRAFAEQPEVERVLIAGPLVKQLQESGETWAWKIQDGGKKHQNHIHVDISPP
jgi:hypothetical protein